MSSKEKCCDFRYQILDLIVGEVIILHLQARSCTVDRSLANFSDTADVACMATEQFY